MEAQAFLSLLAPFVPVSWPSSVPSRAPSWPGCGPSQCLRLWFCTMLFLVKTNHQNPLHFDQIPLTSQQTTKLKSILCFPPFSTSASNSSLSTAGSFRTDPEPNHCWHLQAEHGHSRPQLLQLPPIGSQYLQSFSAVICPQHSSQSF